MSLVMSFWLLSWLSCDLGAFFHVTQTRFPSCLCNKGQIISGQRVCKMDLKPFLFTTPNRKWNCSETKTVRKIPSRLLSLQNLAKFNPDPVFVCPWPYYFLGFNVSLQSWKIHQVPFEHCLGFFMNQDSEHSSVLQNTNIQTQCLTPK